MTCFLPRTNCVRSAAADARGVCDGGRSPCCGSRIMAVVRPCKLSRAAVRTDSAIRDRYWPDSDCSEALEPSLQAHRSLLLVACQQRRCACRRGMQHRWLRTSKSASVTTLRGAACSPPARTVRALVQVRRRCRQACQIFACRQAVPRHAQRCVPARHAATAVAMLNNRCQSRPWCRFIRDHATCLCAAQAH